MSEQKFARLLTEAVYTIKVREHSTITVVQDELGYILSRKGGSSIEYWRRGPVDVPVLEKLALELSQRAKYDKVWVCEFLTHGQHPDPEFVCSRMFPTASSKPVNGQVKQLELLAPSSVNGHVIST